MKYVLRVLILTAMSATVIQAAEPPPAVSPLAGIKVDIPFTRFVLKNGLTVIVHEDHKTAQVAVEMTYHVGSKDEPFGRTGFAHLFEHLMFNGSEHFNDDWFKALQPLGATSINGTTNVDRTNYYQTVPTSALDSILWLESDRMGHLLGAIDQAKLDEQRGVVQNEKRQNYDNRPFGTARERTAKAIWPASHPYSHLTIGSMEDLNAASLADVKEWFKTWYGPSNAVLVLAGDITVDQAREKVERYFGAIPPGPPVNHVKAWVAPREGTQREVLHDGRAGAPIFTRVWNVPGEGTADADYLDLLGAVLTQGKTSRLQKRLVFDEQIATDVSAGVQRSEIAGQFMISVGGVPGADMKRIEREVDEELQRLLREGPTADELERIRVPRISGMVQGLQSVAGKASFLSHSEVIMGSADKWKAGFERVKTARPSDLTTAGKRWLKEGDYVLLMLPRGQLTADGVDADRSKMPQPMAGAVVPAPTFERTTLSNGVRVMFAERHDAPDVTMKLMIPTGDPVDTKAFPNGISSLTMSLANEGAGSRSALELSDTLARLGASVYAGGGDSFAQVSMTALKPVLSQTLDIFADLLLRPTFKEEDLMRLKAQSIAQLKSAKGNPSDVAYQYANRFVFGADHPYGRVMTEEGVAAIARADVVRYHQNWIIPNDATLIVVGDTTLAEMKPRLEKIFAGWKPGTPPKTVDAPMPQTTTAAVWLIDAPGAQQSDIQVLMPAAQHAKEKEAPLSMFTTVLGGTFMSRINMNLREDKHWSYGARAGLSSQLGVRVFSVGAPVQTDRTAEALSEIRKELSQVLADKPITAQELAAVQKEMTLGLADIWETHSNVSEALSQLVYYSMPDDYLQNYAHRVNQVLPEDARKAGESLLKGRQLTWVIAGDLSKIEKGVRALNLGEVKVFDNEGRVVR